MFQKNGVEFTFATDKKKNSPKCNLFGYIFFKILWYNEEEETNLPLGKIITPKLLPQLSNQDKIKVHLIKDSFPAS